MTHTEPAAPAQDRTLSLDFDLPHPPEKVWRALTDPELLAEWLMPVVGLRLEPGAAFTFRSPATAPGWDGTVSCRLLEIEPSRRLAYSWTVPFLDTRVTFTLVPTASGTRLTIEQSGFPPAQKREFGGARYGWIMMGAKLVDLLARMP